MQPVEGAIEAPGALAVQRLDRRPVDAVQLDVVRAVATGTEVAHRERAIIVIITCTVIASIYAHRMSQNCCIAAFKNFIA